MKTITNSTQLLTVKKNFFKFPLLFQTKTPNAKLWCVQMKCECNEFNLTFVTKYRIFQFITQLEEAMRTVFATTDRFQLLRCWFCSQHINEKAMCTEAFKHVPFDWKWIESFSLAGKSTSRERERARDSVDKRERLNWSGWKCTM